MIKPVDKYIYSAKTERRIIDELCRRDPDDRYHIIRFYGSLYHYNHFCLVFERLGLSLYELIKKNNYVGFSPRLVQSFARQLLKAVNFMH